MTVSLWKSVLEIFEVSCFDNPGVERLTKRPVEYGSRLPIMGSDSPSNTAAFVSCSSEELRCCKVSFGRVAGMLGTLGLCRVRSMML